MKISALVIKEHKFIFVPIPKAANSSVKDAIVKLLGLEWRGETHLRWRKGVVPEVNLAAKEYNDYFKFTFVRNPFDRLVSAYHSHILFADKPYKPEVEMLFGARGPKAKAILAPIRRKIGKENISFDDFVFYLSKSRDYKLNHHWRPQYTFVCSRSLFKKRLLVDFVGKVENIENDWKEVCSRMGIGDIALPHTNKIPRKHYHEFYSVDSAALVAKRYREDFERFGYETSI